MKDNIGKLAYFKNSVHEGYCRINDFDYKTNCYFITILHSTFEWMDGFPYEATISKEYIKKIFSSDNVENMVFSLYSIKL